MQFNTLGQLGLLKPTLYAHIIFKHALEKVYLVVLVYFTHIYFTFKRLLKFSWIIYPFHY